jgi:hypothetical protein
MPLNLKPKTYPEIVTLLNKLATTPNDQIITVAAEDAKAHARKKLKQMKKTNATN